MQSHEPRREERHDRHQRKCRFESTHIQRRPREGSWYQEIRPETSDPLSPQQHSRAHSAAHQEEERCELDGHGGRGAQRQDAERVGADSKKEEERNDRTASEDDPYGEVPEREIHGEEGRASCRGEKVR